jgi:hypothetical protein
VDLHANVGIGVPAMVPGATPGDSQRRDMPTEYVRGYQDQSGGSHMFALWTRESEPDESDTDGWTWVMADKVTHLWRRHDSTWGKIVTVVCLVDFNCFLLTLAAAEDVRWGIDLALNGGKHRDRDGQ